MAITDGADIGPALGLDLVVWVNVAARQLAAPDLVDQVARTLAGTGAQATWLGLEVTESSVLYDAAASVATLRALRRLGASLAIDDFVTEYSVLGLAYLKRLPVDLVKVDRSFVEGL